MSYPHVDTDRAVWKQSILVSHLLTAQSSVFTFESLDTLEPGELVDLLAGYGENLISLDYAAPATGSPGSRGLGTAALDVETSHRLTGPASTLKPQTEPQLLPGPPHDRQLLLSELALGLRLQALDGDVPGGGREDC